MFELLGVLGGIILVDLVLSGDNALIIGAAAAGLPRRQRWWAIALGGGGAIVLRIAFAIIATLLLRLPLLQAIGGLLLLIIAIRLLLDRGKDNSGDTQSAQSIEQHKIGLAPIRSVKRSFVPALLTILIADVTMSLDNVLAIGALASGHLLLLAIGLLLSIGLLLLGSALVAELIGRLPWLLDIAALVLGWTAARMILDDIHLKSIFEQFLWVHIALPAAALLIVLVADILIRRRMRPLSVVR